MILKVRAAAIAAAVFAFAGAALVGGPAAGLSGRRALLPDHLLSRPRLGAARRRHARPQRRIRPPRPADAPFAGRPGRERGRRETGDAEQECLANAVYFEARGEPLRGQLAVAEVVMNRAASGRFPASLCGVVVQPRPILLRPPRPHAARRPRRRKPGAAPSASPASPSSARRRGCCRRAACGTTPITCRRAGATASPRTTRIGLHIFYS